MPRLTTNLSYDELRFHSVSRENNMNVIRYYLSFCVLLAHLSVLTNINYPWIQRGTVDVGCFFAISGFLMFPSFQKRPTLKHYISRRARRILPPYVLIIALCAFSFIFISNLTCSEYFANPVFWKYLLANLSFMNFLNPDLPGVFTGDEFITSAVNGSLWTMKGEWVCYLSVPLVYYIISRISKKAGGILLAAIAITAIAARAFFLNLALKYDSQLYDIIARQFGTLLVFFYIGAFINYYFDIFKKYHWIVIIFDIIILLLSDFIPFYNSLLQPIVAGSMVLWFSMIGKWGSFLCRHDSISYDIYLFHFPIIQLCIFLNLPEKLSPIGLLAIVLLITASLATASWNLIGKKFSRPKKDIVPTQHCSPT